MSRPTPTRCCANCSHWHPPKMSGIHHGYCNGSGDFVPGRTGPTHLCCAFKLRRMEYLHVSADEPAVAPC